MKEETAKVGLKLNIQKTKIMAYGPITSWQIDEESVETVLTLFGEAPKSLQMVTAAMKFRNKNKNKTKQNKKNAYSLEGKLWPI